MGDGDTNWNRETRDKSWTKSGIKVLKQDRDKHVPLRTPFIVIRHNLCCSSFKLINRSISMP